MPNYLYISNIYAFGGKALDADWKCQLSVVAGPRNHFDRTPCGRRQSRSSWDGFSVFWAARQLNHRGDLANEFQLNTVGSGDEQQSSRLGSG